jgi:uncharacterized protein (DUF1330 family)
MKTNHKLMFAIPIVFLVDLVVGVVRAQQVKTPTGYVVAEVEVTDLATMQEYGKKVPETLAPFNHHYVVRSSQVQALEGEPPKGLVVIAFDSVEKAREWYDSPAYQAIKPIRQRAANSEIFIVQGLVPQ